MSSRTRNILGVLALAILFMNFFIMPAFTQDIHKAVRNGDIEKVKQLLEKDKELVKLRDINNNTPLHLACRAAHKEIVELLILNGADVDAKNDYGRSPLHLAWREKGSARISQILIENGADIDLKNNFGETPLSVAVAVGNEDMLNVLIKNNARVPITGNKGKELLHRAASKGFAEFVDLMIERGVDTSSTNNNGGTLLHSAAFGGLVELMEKLIKDGTNVNELNRYGLSPLHRAASEGHKKVIELLIKNGAKIDIESHEGKTPFHLAADQGNEEIVKFFISKGARNNPPKFPVLKGKYLGMKRPGLEPEIFAPGIVSSILTEHSSAIFSPDGKEVYWSPIFINPVTRRILFMKLEDGQWTPPQPASFSTQFYCSNPTFSPDGKKLFFYSRRPSGTKGEILSGIWFVERQDSRWSEPQQLDLIADLEGVRWSVSVTEDGTLYFGSTREGGKGMSDIYRSKLVNGKYDKPQNLGDPINTKFSEGTPFFSPDGSYFIFSGDIRKDGFGGADLSICFRKRDGSWTEAINMGAKINTSSHEPWASVSPDGKYIFFVSFKNGNGDIYWIDAKIIGELKPEELR
ncbi:MAG: ankyrin repeat domain-containing protein [Candidatus Aminicenantes bacterium]|nr:MAG: ankyrin repeat domain-containing protein [Candidatus Aminicenantes bacterium]